jgi:hypothetical protein
MLFLPSLNDDLSGMQPRYIATTACTMLMVFRGPTTRTVMR